jgi:phospholipid/cholesterol/gamma-HCH transport system substrate-binding protein
MSRRGRLAPGIVGLAVAVLAILFVLVSFVPQARPWRNDMHLKVRAAAFGQINQGAWVELSGSKVGSVDRVEFQDGYSLIHLTIEPRYFDQLHSDASAAIRPHGLLGPKYVFLDGGSGLGTLKDGSTIPLSRSTVGTDFDQILNSLQPDVRDNLKTIFVELGRASEGRGADMNATFKALGSSSGDISRTSVLHDRAEDLAALITASEQLNRDLQDAPIDRNLVDTDRVLTALVAVEESLGKGFDRTASVAQKLDVALRGNSANLAQILAKGPRTMTHLQRMALELDAILTGINPALPSLMQAVMETKSAFQGRDGNGHYVRVQVVKHAEGPGETSFDAPGPSIMSGKSQAPRLSDEELIALFLGT